MERSENNMYDMGWWGKCNSAYKWDFGDGAFFE